MEALNPLGNNVKTIIDKSDKKDLQAPTEAKKNEPVEEEVVAAAARPQIGTPKSSSSVSTPQSETRNMNFKLNDDSNEMYVEITNSNDEVVKIIPADKNDPRFVELLSNSKPGMIIDNKL